jgi:hypothetical protein
MRQRRRSSAIDLNSWVIERRWSDNLRASAQEAFTPPDPRRGVRSNQRVIEVGRRTLRNKRVLTDMYDRRGTGRQS